MIENSLGSGSKGIQNGVWIRRVRKHHRTRTRVAFTEFLQGSEPTLSILLHECAEDEHVDSLAARSGHQTCGIQVRTDDLQIGITLEGPGQQLRMEPRLVGDEYTDWTKMPVVVEFHWRPL